MKKKRLGRRWAIGLMAPLLGILGLAAGGYAFGKPFGGDGGHGHRMFGRMLHHLDLSEDQELMVVRMHRKMRAEKKATHQELKGVFLSAKGQLAKENVDSAEVHALVDQATDRVRQSMHKMVDEYLEIHKTLTPAQRDKLAAGLEKMEKRMRRLEERHRE